MGAGRAYEIALHGPGKTRSLSQDVGGPTVRPSQREFTVSPGGRYLAYREGKSGNLVVRSRAGRTWRVGGIHMNDYRFSPGGEAIAYFRSDDALSGPFTLGVLELETGARRELAEMSSPQWLEWTSEGVVVLSYETGRTLLDLVSLEGEERRLYDDNGISRFTAASQGRHVAFFDRDGAHIIDLADKAAEAKTVWAPDQAVYVSNAELSPDGRALAFASGGFVYLLQAGAEEIRLPIEGLHSVWFSEDGETLLVGGANEVVAMDLESRRRRRLAPKAGPLKSLRFRRDGPGAVLTAGREVLYWDWESGATEVAHRSPARHRLEGADSFGEELVVWSSRRIEPRRPNKSAQKKRRSRKRAIQKQQAVVAPPRR